MLNITRFQGKNPMIAIKNDINNAKVLNNSMGNLKILYLIVKM